MISKCKLSEKAGSDNQERRSKRIIEKQHLAHELNEEGKESESYIV